MELTIRPEAKANFNSKICDLVKVIEFKNFEERTTNSKIDSYNTKQINAEEIIGNIIVSETNSDGIEISKSIHTQWGYLGLFNLNFVDFKKVCLGIQNINFFKNYVSLTTIQEFVFNWIIKKYHAEIAIDPLDHILEECAKIIRKHEIIIPISELFIEDEFYIGKVKFVTLKKENIDYWENENLKKGNHKSNFIEEKKYYEELRKTYIGKAVAFIVIEAEHNLAIELAKEEINKSLSILRLFSKAAFDLEIISTCTIEGEGYEKYLKTFILDQGVLVTSNVVLKKEYSTHWNIKKRDIELFIKLGIENLIILISKDALNEFETKYLDAIIIFSKNMIMPTIYDKIIYILSSLESLLILDTQEHIQQNLSERIAILIGNNLSEKKEIIKTVKDIYKIRSKFLHHGLQGIKDEEKKKIRDFAKYSLRFYLHLANNLGEYNTRRELIDFIENQKLS